MLSWSRDVYFIEEDSKLLKIIYRNYYQLCEAEVEPRVDSELKLSQELIAAAPVNFK